MSDDTTPPTPAATPEPEAAGAPPAPAPRRGRRRTGSGGFFGAWIGIGAMLGLLVGVFFATAHSGPALVSPQRSLMWLGVFFAALGALAGAVVAVLLDGAAHRGR